MGRNAGLSCPCCRPAFTNTGTDAADSPQDEPILRPAKQAITLRHLITHTAGFVYDIWNGDMGRYMATKDIPGIITCENAALALPLVFDPGNKWDYGINIDWVGKAVERVSGQRLGDYLSKHLFEPIGIKDTGFKLTDEHRTRLAGMHARDETGTFARVEFEIPQDPEFQMGGGGLYGTASDYLAFQRVFLNEGQANGQRVLKPETVRLMTANAIGDLAVRPLKTVVPNASTPIAFQFQGCWLETTDDLIWQAYGSLEGVEQR